MRQPQDNSNGTPAKRGNGQTPSLDKNTLASMARQVAREIKRTAKKRKKTAAPAPAAQARPAVQLPQPSMALPNAPRYGQAYYDSGVRYAVTDPAPPVNDGGKVKLELDRKTDTELINFTLAHITDMTGNDNFLNPQPPAVDFQALADAFTAAVTAKLNAENAAKDATALRDAARLALTQAFSSVRGPYVQLASNGNTQVILSAGLPVRSGPTPAAPLPPPVNLQIDLNGTPGVMIITWNVVPGSRSFILQRSPADSAERIWETVSSSTSRNVTLNDQTVGQAYAFRVAAIGGANGQSDWSREVTRTAA